MAAQPSPARTALRLIRFDDVPSSYACGCCSGVGIHLGRDRCVCPEHSDPARGAATHVCQYHEDPDHVPKQLLPGRFFAPPTRVVESAGHSPRPVAGLAVAEVTPSAAAQPNYYLGLSDILHWNDVALLVVVVGVAVFFGSYILEAVHAGRGAWAAFGGGL